jgi:pyridoxal phosphate enzyme (YggS family)
MSIRDNIVRMRERIAAAAQRSGRNAADITLMAVSKTFPPELIREAYAAGIRVFGENRVQEFGGKVDALRDLESAEWHLIGHLQSNKAAKAVELFAAVDSLDSVRLADRLNRKLRVGSIRGRKNWSRFCLERRSGRLSRSAG